MYAYHVVDLVHTNQSRSELEHVVSQGNDNELCILGSLLDIAGHNRDLCLVSNKN